MVVTRALNAMAPTSVLTKKNICFLVIFTMVICAVYVTNYSPTSVIRNLCEKTPTIDIVEMQLIHKELNDLVTAGNPRLVPIVQRLSKVMQTLDSTHQTNLLNQKQTDVNQSTVLDVCPERYHGTKAGYMYFVTGWKMDNCTNAALFHKVLTVIFYPAHDAPAETIERVIKGIRKSYPLVTVLMPNFTVVSLSKPVLNNITSVRAEKTWSVGKVWNALIKKVATPYVFLGRDLDYFVDWLARLERQIRIIGTIPGAKIAGGAVRNRTAHWQVGCYQSDMYNYILRYREGYYSSTHECMYCDHLVGPFVAETEVLREITLSEKLPPSVVFEDFFLSVKQKKYLVLDCPDVLHLASNNAEWVTKQSKDNWQPLAKKWELNRVILPNGKVHGFSCGESGLVCTGLSSRTNWFLIPPCCIEQYAKAVSELHKFALKHNIVYELDAGSALGIVKVNDYIPWDLDGDMTFYNNNYTLFFRSAADFTKLGIKLKQFEYTNKIKTRSYFTYNTPDLYIEFWGEQALSKDLYEQEIFQQKPTLVKLHDMWIYGSISPGLLARNRYGKEVLKHDHSWIQLGMKSSWEEYKPGSFKKCKTPLHHSCLDHFAADGNLQFKVPNPN